MLLNLANYAADIDDNKKSKILRQMKLSERRARVYNLLKFQRNKDQRSGCIDRLEIPKSWPDMHNYDETIDHDLPDPKSVNPKDPSLWKVVNCPKEIEFYLRLRNQRHFGQAEGTPFTTPSMKQKFNWSASTNEAELVLEGNYKDDELTEIQRMLLDHMKRSADTTTSSSYLSSDEFDSKMKKWRESTSTSPSGRHLGHYKALVSVPDHTLDDSDFNRIKCLQLDIKKCYIGLINYCIRHHYSLDRWKEIINCMIYKEPGNVKINRLRVIHIYEADQSTLWANRWRDQIRKAINDETMHPGQFGGLPGRSSTSVTFLEELRFDYVSLSRFPFANFDNDATACYDRILLAIASLAGKKYGIHSDVIFVHAKTLEEAEFKLKTLAGISKDSYKHCIKFPIHGVGQGSTNASYIWCFVSSILFQTHQKYSNGMVFHSPLGDIFVRYNMVGFVDDSACITGGCKNDSLEELKKKMTQDAQLWHDLLWSSGGGAETFIKNYMILRTNEFSLRIKH